jgi:hypothetical protein
MTALSEAMNRYGATVVGLALGTAAKNGLALNEGRPITWRSLLADTLQMGFLCLIAVSVSDYLGLTGNAKVLAGAMAAVSSDRLIVAVRRKFEERFAAELDQLPASRLARLIGGDPPKTTPALHELLAKIDEADDAQP